MRPLLFISLLALCPVAAQAARQAPADVFLLTVAGTATAVWNHTDCDTALGSEGVRTAHFRSSAPTVVHFVHGRLQPVDARGLAGTITLTGTNLADAACGDDGLPSDDRCGATTRRFSNARVRLTAGGVARVLIAAPRVVLPGAQCPREPADVVSRPLGQKVGPLRMSTHTLAEHRTVRITLTATATRRKTYGKTERGTLTQRATWKLTFVRTGR